MAEWVQTKYYQGPGLVGRQVQGQKALVLGSINWAREGHTFSLRPQATVFQAEICAIKAYVLWNIKRATHIGKESNHENQPPYLALLPPVAK